jgi:hypothetical protein
MGGVYPDRKIREECIQIGRYGRSISRYEDMEGVYPVRKIWEEYIQIGRYGKSVSK